MISFFSNKKEHTPSEQISPENFLQQIKEGKWANLIEQLQNVPVNTYAARKAKLPQICWSVKIKTRNKDLPFDQRVIEHTGKICLDIDFSDNPTMRVRDIIDKDCYAQYLSPSQKGKKVIYNCKKTLDPKEHRRIYDACIKRLKDKGINLKVDPMSKSIIAPQYVSWDPNLYFNPKTKLVVQPLPPLKLKPVVTLTNEQHKKTIEDLNYCITQLGTKDVTGSDVVDADGKKVGYHNWWNIGFGLSYSLGEDGREIFHKISGNYPNYNAYECDDFYDACIERSQSNHVDRPVTVGTVFKILEDYLPKVTISRLRPSHIKRVIPSENLPTKKKKRKKIRRNDENQEKPIDLPSQDEKNDLLGKVQYGLFLFKKILDNKFNIVDLEVIGINLNGFEALLREKNFYRYNGKQYIQVIDNIIRLVDEHDIIKIITTHIEQDGNYNFNYQNLELFFSWEELAHLWRQIRGNANIRIQIADALNHFQENILTDTADESFIPFKNGVLKITKKKIELISYQKINKQIWHERIIQKDFKFDKKFGMFENFFGNVCGRGNTREATLKSIEYKKSLWYYGYMLHSIKRKSLARAWLLYDINTGNNGRSGKTILGESVSYVRSVCTIPGKSLDMMNRFKFNTIQPHTEIVFIDDPYKRFSLNACYNLVSGTEIFDRKNLNPIVKAVKVMIASNWVVETEGDSDEGRQFITHLSDYYKVYAKKHNSATPVVDIHGKEFFTDWNEKDWNKFYSFCAKALQYYFKNKVPVTTIESNSRQLRFVQLHEQELFYELCCIFIENVRKGRNGSLLVPTGILIDKVKSYNSQQMTVNIAGKIARDFIKAINGGEVIITTALLNRMNTRVYEIQKDFYELNFGATTKDLPKPNFGNLGETKK